MKKSNKMKIAGITLTVVMIAAILGVFGFTASAAADYITVEIDTGAEVSIGDTDGNGAYEIGTADELYAFAAAVNGGNNTINAELTANIVVNENVLTEDNKLNGSSSNFRSWNPINSYAGIFDGKNHTVSGLYYRGAESSIAMFATLDTDGKVQNLGVIDSYFYSGSLKYGAGVVGCNYGIVMNCYNAGVVSGGRFDTSEGSGGVVGINFAGKVANCYNKGKVSGIYAVGGVVGNNDNGDVANCYNEGNVSGSSLVGGVVGGNLAGKVASCYNEGNVSGSSIVGGVIGGHEGGDVTSCYYLAGTADGGINGADVSGQAEVKDAEWFDEYPICRVVGFGHEWEKGFCINGCYEPATLNEGGYYEIGNAGQLYWFSEHVNAGDNGVNAVLTADIVVNENVLTEDNKLNGSSSNFRVWTPIDSYAGTFDGKNHTISGLYRYSVDFAIFSELDTAGVVQNLGVIDYLFGGNTFLSKIAGIVCDNNGNVTNCYVVGVVSGGNNIGGVVAVNYGSITNCYNAGVVSGTMLVGGVVGRSNSGNVTNCYNIGNVSGNSYVGGVVGNRNEGNVTNCYYLDTCGAAGEGTAVIEAQLKSGEVAYLLGEAFGQNLSENGDSYPVFATKNNKVYRYTSCDGKTYGFTNDAALDGKKLDHSYDNGICNICNDYQSANLNEDGYYEIGNAGQMFWFARLVNIDGQTSANAILTADIDLEGRRWYPIGLYNDIAEENGDLVVKQYSGTFDGNGHTVSNFVAIGNGSQGVLGYCSNTTSKIKNLGVINATVSGWNAGAVAGFGANIENCYALGCTIIGKSDINTTGVTISSLGGNNGSNNTIINCFAYNCTLILGEGEESYVMHPLGGINASNNSACNIQNSYYVGIVTEAEITNTDKAIEKSLTELKSGDVAYLLGSAWGQKIGTDLYPVFATEENAVYQSSYCDGTAVYVNNDGEILHKYNEYGCCVCEATFVSASLAIGQDLSIYYTVFIDDSILFGTPTVRFSMGERSFIAELTATETAGNYIAKFVGIGPHQMTEIIDAELLIGESVVAAHRDYTLREYAEELISAYAENEYIVALLSDMLDYGAAAQNYRDNRTDDLANAGIESGEELLPETTDLTLDGEGSEEVYFKAAGVWFDNVNKIYVKTVGLENATVKAYKDGAEVALTVKDGIVYTEAIYAIGFADVYTFELYVGEEKIQTLTYSVNSYVYSMMNNTEADGETLTEMALLARALYNYGVSAVQYANEQ